MTLLELIVLAHVAVFTLRPIRTTYLAWLPASGLFSAGLVAGLIVGAWLVTAGLPAWTLPVNMAIWAIGGARLPRELGWTRKE